MKKILICVLSALMMISVFSNHVYAEENNTERNESSIHYTEEPSMPVLSENLMKECTQNEKQELKEQRAKWLSEVIEYNENHYNQRVIEVKESNERYIIYFEPIEDPDCESVVHDYELNGIEELDESRWGVSRIEYIKPESVLSKSINEKGTKGSVVVNGITYDYKFTYYYGWSDGYYEVASKSFISYLAIGADAVMNFTIDIKNKLISWVISQAMGAAFSSLDQSKPVKAKTYNKFYYETKVCSVKKTGTSMWYPTCQIGRRCAFGWCWCTVTLNTGEPVIKHDNPKNANGYPPTNYDSQAKKNYFDNDTWMINKAIEKMTTGGYADVYAICTTPRP